jgi:hypothetical protein
MKNLKKKKALKMKKRKAQRRTKNKRRERARIIQKSKEIRMFPFEAECFKFKETS